MARRSGGDKLFQKNKEKAKVDFKRATNDRHTVNDVIIACEDSVSSPAYFKMIIEQLIKAKKITQDSIVIVPHDGATHPTGVLANLKNYKNQYGKTYKEFDHKWIVIDRDVAIVNAGGHTAQDFNNAINNAKNKRKDLNVDVAYANDAFELWYLLHFEYRTTPIIRDEIVQQVVKKLKEIAPLKFASLNRDNIKQAKYTKLIFETLQNSQSRAIDNATRLLNHYGENHNPENENPSTSVHKLVKILNSLGKKEEKN
ncbi:MAG: RloB domain-containing protein [Sulfuricurvum sp.]|uniref:RloB family protein n=1 Tax=Sulfuricurvum sp. TaxID=2025608 RepID=UPI0025E66216|nr:RloB family protein [Sulfuricurvum sp.]MCI4407310.1 RloB domain-containing protein [Sulfuricurvum sp.]